MACTAVAARVCLTRQRAIELAKESITANAAAPGSSETEVFRANNAPGSKGEARQLAQISAGRFGKPEEISALIAFVASEQTGFIIG